MGSSVLALALAACAADDDSRSADRAEGAADDEAPDAGFGDVPSGQPVIDEGDILEPGERAIIYEADIGVHVDDVEEATDEAVAAAEAVDGHLESQRSNFQDELQTDLTLKVPPEDLNDVLDTLADLGELFRRDLESQDVTEELVDLEGRLSSAEASAERLREMLSGTETIADLVEIEGTLAEREANVESLQGQLTSLSSQVEMATIDLRLTEDPDAADPGVSEDIPGFLRALRTGWVSLVNVILVLLMVVGFLLPFSPFIAGGWWGYQRYRRRHPHRRPADVLGPPPAPGAVQPDEA